MNVSVQKQLSLITVEQRYRGFRLVKSAIGVLLLTLFGLSPVAQAAPDLTATTMVGVLQVDADSDTLFSPGDTIRYIVTIDNTGDTTDTNVVFTLTPDTDTTLPGSTVTTTLGTITTGNTAGDITVQVDVGSVAVGTPVTIKIDVTINSPLDSCTTSVTTQGTVTSDTHSGGILTDDINNAAVDDATVTSLTVPNNAPTAADNTVSTPQNAQKVFSVADFNYADIDCSDSLSKIQITQLESVGDLYLDANDNSVLNTGEDIIPNQEIGDTDIIRLKFEPVTDATGSPYTTFKFKVNDATEYSAAEYTMTIDVVPNAAPTGADKTVTINEDAIYTFAEADFGFSDVDTGDTLASIEITLLETAGALQFSGADVKLTQVILVADIPNLVFTPTADGNGSPYTTFQFTVNDGNVDSTSAYTITMDVTPQPDNPTAADNTVTTNEDTSYTFAEADFGFSDVDTGDTLASVKITQEETAGALKLSGADVNLNDVIAVADIPNLTFDPAANANGTGYDTFQFTVIDSTAAESSPANTMTIDVTAVNDAPTATDNTITTDEGTDKTFAAGDFNFTDIDTGDTLSQIEITTLPAAGTLYVDANTDSIVDGGEAVIAAGTVAFADITKLTFKPVANASGSPYTTFTFKVYDGTAYSTSAYTMTINVVPNTAPTAADNTVTINEDTAYTFALVDFVYADAESHPFTSIEITQLETAGALQLSGADVNLNNVIAVADITAGDLKFVPAADANGSPYTTFQFTVNDGIDDSTSAYMMTINVTADNDPPTSADSTVTTTEDNDKVFADSEFNFTDIDTGDTLSQIEITTLPAAGTLYVDANTDSIVDGGEAVIALGTVAFADITNLKFKPVANANGTPYTTFTFKVYDGTDYSTLAYTMTINVTAVNDAPTAADNTVTTNENTDKTFTEAEFNFSDVDTGDTLSQIEITTLPGAGTLYVDANTDSIVDGSEAVIAPGTVAFANIPNLKFKPVANANGTGYDTFQFTVNDGTADSASAYTMTIDVTAINDAPSFFGLDNTPTFIENGSAVVLDSNATVADPELDAANNYNGATLTLARNGGTNADDVFGDSSGTLGALTEGGNLTVGGTNIGTVTTNSGGTLLLTFDNTNGTPTQTLVNDVLQQIAYSNSSELPPTSVQIDYTIDDGNTTNAQGTGGALTGTGSITVTIIVANDKPINTVPGTQTIDEDNILTFSTANTNVISISDADAGTNPVKVYLIADKGTLTLSGVANLTFTTGDGTDDASMVFTGTITDINTALDGMSFTPQADFNGTGACDGTAACVQILTNDQGNTGGGALVDDDTVAITINAVNDAPINTVPNAQSVDEDTTLTFSTANSNLISISDDAANPIKVTLTATSGTLTLAGTTGLTFNTGDGTDDASMEFTGTVAAINTALDGISFSPTAEYSGAASVQIHTDDQGETGGGILTASNTVNITVNAVNDTPVNSVPSAQTMNEDDSLIFNTANSNLISISDDAGTNPVQVTLTATSTLTLSGTTGLTFSVGDGTDDTNMAFTGTITDINAALDGMSYTPTADYNGAAGSVQIVTNDQGNTGSTGALIDDDTISITVNAVNDAPINTVPAAQTMDEDTTLTFSTANSTQISISDVDAGSNEVQVTLTATNGTLTLAGTTSLTFSTGTGTNEANIVFTGTVTDINTAIDGMIFTPTATYSGAASVQIITDDQGNTGGGALNDDDTVTITINAVNDAPVNSVPSAPSVDEDTTLTLSTANSNLISISDEDAGSNEVKVTLTATNGTLTLAGTTGLTFNTGTGTNEASMEFTGTVADINTALDGISFAPTAGYNGSASLQIVTDDQGNTGSGSALSDDDTVNITVNAVNDAPVNSVPSAPSVDEDTTLTLSTANANLISISDEDAGSNSVQVALAASNGTLTLNGTTNLTFVIGDGSDDANIIFSGTITDINTALDGLSFNPTTGYNGSASLQIVTNDQGNTGSGGALSDDDTVTITVNAVNDAPINTVPAAQTMDEDTTLTFSTANSTLISISDVDAGSNSVQVTLTANNGILTLAGTTSLTFSTGTGTNEANMVFTGTVTDINTALDGMIFNPTAEFGGTASVQIVTDDLGNTGTGGALNDDDTVTITVNAVNDAPINSVPSAQSVDEDTTLTLSTANSNLISISDADAGSNEVQVSLTATNGTLTLTGTTGLTLTTGDGTDDADMVFTGTITDINTALDGMSFTPTATYSGAASVQIVTDDQGHTGSGGALSDDDTVNITVNAVNDAPINTVPAAQTMDEDTSLTFSTANSTLISISDVDAGSNEVQVTLTATNGTLTLADTTGLTITAPSDGTDDASMEFTGTVTDINTALDGMIFNPTAEFGGSASVQIVTDDQGNTGTGGALNDDDTVNITVNTLNDAPINMLPTSALMINENSTLTFSTADGNLISISDADAGSNEVQVTLTATNGTLTLSGITRLTFITGTGTDDTSMEFTGTLTDINMALEGMGFTIGDSSSSSASLQIVTNDQGNSGNGGALSDDDTINLTVNITNQAPVNTVPGSQNLEQDTSLTFSTANGNGISISDADAGNGLVSVMLVASNGTLTLSGTTGLSLTSGDGNSDASLVFTGTIADINAALEGLSFSPTTGYSGSANVQIVTNDQGNTGNGGPQSDSDTVSMTISPVVVPNNAPTFTSTPVTEATEGSLYLYNITTADAEGDTVTITHQSDLPSWLTLPTGAGDSKTLVGQLGAGDAAGSPYTIVLRVTDAIGDFTEQEFTLTVINVNNAPVLDSSGDMSLTAIDEDTTAADNTGTLVSAIIASAGANRSTDADSGTIIGIAVIAVDNSNGTWQYDKEGGSNFTAFPAVAENQAVLLEGGAKIRFVPNANYFGTVDAGITFRAWDGSSGANGDSNVDTTTNGGVTAFSSATESAAIIVNAINDLPALTSTPITEATPESPYNYTVTASDIDNAGSDLKFTGMTIPAWLTLTDNQDGTATLGGTPSQSDVGAHPITVQVTDANSVNAAASQDFTINVIGQAVLEALTLTVNPASFVEVGGTAVSTGTVTRPNTSGVLLITLESSDSSEVTVPSTVEIPDTQSSVSFNVNAVDDTDIDGTQTVTLTASAAGYTEGTATVSVIDDDVPPIDDNFPVFMTLFVTSQGNGKVTGPSIDCPDDCSNSYDSGTKVTLIATPDTGWQFVGWKGQCDDTGSVILTTDKECQAIFARAQLTLTVEKDGEGSVTSEPAGIDCGEECSAAYDKDTEVMLTATSEAGWELKGWEGDCQSADSDTTSNIMVAAVTMDADKTCKANFAQVPMFTLTVVTDGEGTVTSEQVGIDCGEDCSEAYDKDTEVTLTATPKAGWQFEAFQGECNIKPLEFSDAGQVIMTTDQDCEAHFVQRCSPNGMVIDTVGQVVGYSDSCFTGSLTAGGIEQPNNVALNYFEGIDIKHSGTITAAPEHVGKSADILVVAAYRTLLDSVLFARDGQDWVDWERQSRLPSVETVTLPKTAIDVAVFDGDLIGGPGNYTAFIGYRLEDGTIHYNGIDPQRVSIGNAASVDMRNHSELCFTCNEAQATDYFQGYVRNKGKVGNHLTFTDSGEFEVASLVRVDSRHLGQSADIFITVTYQSPVAALPAISFMREGDEWQIWDGQLDSLAAAVSYTELPERFDVLVYQGPLVGIKGEWIVNVGYRLDNGVLVYGLDPIRAIIE